ncbi:MAG: efflux RND transporter permease subunit [Desulfobacterales bacterium]|nr:efflux RND transporter permease subunit [Desulfobacterales bacterium]
MSAITRFSLNDRRMTIVFIATVIIMGLVLFFDFPRQEDPPIVIREVVVTAFFPGMAPTDMEELVTRLLEAELRTLPELADIWSYSRHGVSIIHAETRDEIDDLDLVWQKVRNKMLDVKPALPEGTIGPFVNDEFGLVTVASIALWSEGFTMAEMRIVARDIRDRLYELPGIRKIELYGVHDEQVFLKFSAIRLAQFGITVREIINTLVEQNVILPGGRVDASEQRIIVTPTGNFQSIDDIADVEFTIPDTRQTILLKDFMTVERGYRDPPQDLVYFNGQRAIVIGVSITPGVNAVAFGERLTRKLDALEAQLEIGYVLEYATFQPDLVEAAVNGGLNNVYQTVGIVLVVVIIFLGVRTGLIVGSFVPLTMLMGLIVMRLFEIELERVSIASCIIALGMLVDNGIVIAEDIRSRMERGQERREACLETGRTLAIPLLTSSLTTILAFMPMLLIDGQVGDYAFSLPMVVIILLLSSWFLSMYVTPAMCFWFMQVKAPPEVADTDSVATEDPYAGRFYGIYRNLLARMLKLRLIVAVGAVAAILGGGLVASQLVREFFGPSDRNQFLVYIDLPAGYGIETTDATVRRLTEWLADENENPEVKSTIAYVGTGGPRFFLVLAPVQPNPHVAFMVVDTETGDQVVPVMKRLRGHFAAHFPEAALRVKQMWLGNEEPGNVEIRLIGLDREYLFAKGRELADALQALPGTLDVYNDWENMLLNTRIQVDQVRARRAGVTSREVARSLQAHMDGITITDYREEDTAIPVVARSNPEYRDDLGDLWNVLVNSSRLDEMVPLTQIADIQTYWDFFRVNRRNQERCLTVEFKHENLLAPELLEAARPLIDALGLAPGYRWEVGGELETSVETVGKMQAWMPLCIFGIVVLLIWQFKSFRRPLIIFITIPLAFTGAFIGLLLMRAAFDFFAILGLLSLAGVIINNGIVLIDKIDSERAAGNETNAVVDAAISRFRPILMTTVTTVLGLMPLIISNDPLFFSMAVVIASGLILGTVLTLGVVPVLYAVFMRI